MRRLAPQFPFESSESSVWPAARPLVSSGFRRPLFQACLSAHLSSGASAVPQKHGKLSSSHDLYLPWCDCQFSVRLPVSTFTSQPAKRFREPTCQNTTLKVACLPWLGRRGLVLGPSGEELPPSNYINIAVVKVCAESDVGRTPGIPLPSQYWPYGLACLRFRKIPARRTRHFIRADLNSPIPPYRLIQTSWVYCLRVDRYCQCRCP